MTGEPRLPGSLVVMTPGTVRGGRGFHQIAAALERAVDAAARGGVRSLVLREPFLEDGATLALGARLAAALIGAAEGESTWFGIHDRVHLALRLSANGVHLGGKSLTPPEARQVLGASPIAIGVSTHAGDDLGDSAGADYVFHSPVYAPTSKREGGGAPMGPEGLNLAAAQSRVPVWALGGINEERMASLLPHQNLHGAALIGALWGTSDTPLTGLERNPLMDIEGIEGRAQALSRLASHAFGQRGASTHS